MNIKPATIPMKFELMALLNHIPPMGKDNGKNVANGTYSEKRKQGRNTQISKGKFILMVHFFIKISDKQTPHIKRIIKLAQKTGTILYVVAEITLI